MPGTAAQSRWGKPSNNRLLGVQMLYHGSHLFLGMTPCRKSALPALTWSNMSSFLPLLQPKRL